MPGYSVVWLTRQTNSVRGYIDHSEAWNIWVTTSIAGTLTIKMASVHDLMTTVNYIQFVLCSKYSLLKYFVCFNFVVTYAYKIFLTTKFSRFMVLSNTLLVILIVFISFSISSIYYCCGHSSRYRHHGHCHTGSDIFLLIYERFALSNMIISVANIKQISLLQD